ncbi:hypothetical protein FDECE_13234 [Fusarium decemcellulare]|nr:hypothetical protein FDECE_13234 [Fusarium decemcellulare]
MARNVLAYPDKLASKTPTTLLLVLNISIKPSHTEAFHQIVMCKSNSTEQVCSVSMSTYSSKEKAGIKPTISFCHEIRGSILHALFDRAANINTNSPSTQAPLATPPFATEIINHKAFTKTLLACCNLDFAHQDKTGRFGRLIIPAWKNTIKWMQRKAIKFGIFRKVPETGWIRDPAYTFASDDAAGQWFNNALQQYNGTCPANVSGYRLDIHLPDLSLLSLTDLDTKKTVENIKKKLAAPRQKTKRLQSANKPRSALAVQSGKKKGPSGVKGSEEQGKRTMSVDRKLKVEEGS